MGIWDSTNLAMSPSTSEYLNALPFAALAVLLYVAVIRITKGPVYPLPPGPPGLPLLGNVYGLPKSHEWVTYMRWAHQYGADIIYIKLWTTPIIVVNSAQAAHELFEKRSSIYSDRPRMVMMNELVGHEYNFGTMPYNECWREKRKVFSQEFNATASSQYRPTEVLHTRKLLARLLENSDDLDGHLRHMAGSIILSIAYGIEVNSRSDPLFTAVKEAQHSFSRSGSPGAYFVDSLPWLKYVPAWFPGAGFQRHAREWRASVRASIEVPFDFVKRSMAAGIAISSFTSRMLERVSDGPDEAREHQATLVREVAATMYNAGSDTTVSAIETFVLAMLAHPDIQRKAQTALDDVLHGQRLPEFSDKGSLEYVTAVVKEVLRWRPVTPLALAHRLMREDIYNGCRIPAGSLVIGNAWAILHDPIQYPSPEAFNPDRFLARTDSQKLTGLVNPDPTAAFGFGRRTCPGQYMAFDSIWITVASILTCFNIVPVPDRKPPNADHEYSTGVLSFPKPFECRFRPRTTEVGNLIMTAVDGL